MSSTALSGDTPDAPIRDHGGGLDAAAAWYGGNRADWLDLSTGINPVPYPLPSLPPGSWTALPDSHAAGQLLDAARAFWHVPAAARIVAAPGASALIARLPLLAPAGIVAIPGPTYNEHAAAFRFHGWTVTDDVTGVAEASARVVVHPNNPDGRLWPRPETALPLDIIDESFCDICPADSRIAEAARPGTVVLKSFGKFWGLAGMRLGFAIGQPETVAPLADHLGPWPVAGPALAIGAAALSDGAWAIRTRARLTQDAGRLDALMTDASCTVLGGTDLFRLYRSARAEDLHDQLARHRIWTRRFPYATDWLRVGIPPAAAWDRLQRALA